MVVMDESCSRIIKLSSVAKSLGMSVGRRSGVFELHLVNFRKSFHKISVFYP